MGNTRSFIKRTLNILVSLFLLLGMFGASGITANAKDTTIDESVIYYPGDTISAGDNNVTLQFNDGDSPVTIGNGVTATLASGENQPYLDSTGSKYCFDVSVTGSETDYIITFDTNDVGKPIAVEASLDGDVYRFVPVYSSDSVSDITAVESVTVSPDTATLTLGGDGNTVQLVATVLPVDATEKTVDWSSGDPEVATVSDDGFVTGLKVGTAVITATAGGKSETCTVNVVQNAPISSLHNISINVTGNGVVTVVGDKTQEFSPNTVEFIVTPEEGYTLESLNVCEESGSPVSVSDNSFTMPDSDVTINAVFVEEAHITRATRANNNPVATNIRWDDTGNINNIHYGVWNEPDNTENIAGYEAIVYYGDESKSYSGADIHQMRDGIKGVDFSDFIAAHKSGQYKFQVITKYTDDTASAPSEFSEERVFYTLSITMQTEGGGSEGGIVFYDNQTLGGGNRISETSSIYLPSTPTSEVTLNVEPNTGYVIKGLKLNNADIAVSEEKREISVPAVINSDTTLDVVFEKSEEVVSIIIRVGAGHAELANKLADLLRNDYTIEYTTEGTDITIKNWPKATSRQNVTFRVSVLITDLDYFDPDYPVDTNGDAWYTGASQGVGLKELSQYRDEKELKTESEENLFKSVLNGDTFYIYWMKPITEGSFTVTAPICGTTITTESMPIPLSDIDYILEQDPLPEVTADSGSNMIIETEYLPAHWVTADGKKGFSEVIEGGKTYYVRFIPFGKLGYYISSDHTKFNILVNGNKADILEIPHSSSVYAVAAVEADHDWGEWRVTQIPTLIAPGKKTRVCRGNAEHVEHREIARITYSNVFGNGSKWVKGSGAKLRFVFTRSFDDNSYNFYTATLCDEKTISKTYLTVTKGSTIIDVDPAYLETLSVGEHTLTAVFTEPDAEPVRVSAKFTVEEEKKSSGGGSSKKPAAPVDNVVTCQMAGYPSNYAWNEAAKACQAGYIDAGGIFHPYSTPRNRGTIPNTGDMDLTIYAWIAMLAMTLAVFCGVKLLHEDWEV